LQRETANLPANKLDDALQRGEMTIDDLSDSQIEELRKGAKLLQRAGEHFEKGARLMDMVRAAMAPAHPNAAENRVGALLAALIFLHPRRRLGQLIARAGRGDAAVSGRVSSARRC
jgi:hypothetical protein